MQTFALDDDEALLAFFDFPAEHWTHLKTTNPIESTFATARLRTRITKGPGSRAAGTGDGLQARRGGGASECGSSGTTKMIRKPPRDQRDAPIHNS